MDTQKLALVSMLLALVAQGAPAVGIDLGPVHLPPNPIPVPNPIQIPKPLCPNGTSGTFPDCHIPPRQSNGGMSAADAMAALKHVDEEARRDDPVRRTAEKSIRDGNSKITQFGDVTYMRIGHDVEILRDKAGNVVKKAAAADGDSTKFSIRTARGGRAQYDSWWKKGDKKGKEFIKAVSQAGTAVDKWRKRQEKEDQRHTKSGTSKLLKGAPVGEMWNEEMRDLHGNDDSIFQMTQDSPLLDGVIEAAVSFYGGPSGAAAYAAWKTYHVTGDVNMAMRAGLIAYASAEGGKALNKMPQTTWMEVAKKSAMSGALGGISVAAAGGNENDIKNAFLASGGAVVVQYGKTELKTYSPDAYKTSEAISCISTRSPLSARSVGCLSRTEWAQEGQRKSADYLKAQTASWTGFSDGAELQKHKIISAISELPREHAIPVFGGKYVLTWDFGQKGQLKLGEPHVALTYAGEQPAFSTKVTYYPSKYVKTAVQMRDKAANGISYTAAAVSERFPEYSCRVTAADVRRVRVTIGGMGCAVKYIKNNQEQVVYRTSNGRGACVAEAERFVHSNLQVLHCVQR